MATRTQRNPLAYNYRAVVDTATQRRILGYCPSFGEAQNLAMEKSFNFAYVEKYTGTRDVRLETWQRIED